MISKLLLLYNENTRTYKLLNKIRWKAIFFFITSSKSANNFYNFQKQDFIKNLNFKNLTSIDDKLLNNVDNFMKNQLQKNQKSLFEIFKTQRTFLFFKKISSFKLINKPNYLSFRYQYLNYMYKTLLTDYSYLIGNGMPFYSWGLSEYAQKLKKKKTFNVINKNNKTTYVGNKISVKEKFLFINNFFYYKECSHPFNDLNFFLKIASDSEKIMTERNWILSKPYLFLNMKSRVNDSSADYFFKIYWNLHNFKNFSESFYSVKSLKLRKDKQGEIRLKTLKQGKTLFLQKININKKKLVKKLLYPETRNMSINSFFLENLNYKIFFTQSSAIKSRKWLNYSKYVNFIKKTQNCLLKLNQPLGYFIKSISKHCLFKKTFLIDLKTPILVNLDERCFYKEFKTFSLNTLYKFRFLSALNGFLYLSQKIYKDFEYFTNDNSNDVYEIKKNMYSFTNKNEIHKLLLNSFLKTKSFEKMDSMSESLNIFSVHNFGTCVNTDMFITNLDAFDKKLSILQNLNLSTKFLNTEHDSDSEGFNLNIKRIKFKPGYMRQWREARTVLKKSLNLKYKYQYRLTKYLLRFRNFLKLKLLVPTEMNLLNVLMQSRLVNYSVFANDIIRQKIVYVNGFVCLNTNYQIFCNDFVQLIINIKYYVLNKFWINFLLKKKIKMKKIIDYKNKASEYTFGKKKSFKLPDVILFERRISGDCPKYIELDYFTLSAYIIYEPFLIDDLSLVNHYQTKYSIINLYNWKYIT